MRIYTKVTRDEPDANLRNVKQLDYKTRIEDQQDVMQLNLMKTLQYLFSNTFQIESDVLMDDLIDVPNESPIDFKFLEEKYHGWKCMILEKPINERVLPFQLIEVLFGCPKNEWNSFLPILYELEKTHILYCNIWIYMIKDYSTQTFNVKIETFIDFQKKKNYQSESKFNLEDYNFYTLKEVKDCLKEDLPERFKEMIIHYDDTKDFKVVKKRSNSNNNNNKNNKK